MLWTIILNNNYLTVVLGKLERSDTLGVRLLEPSETLAGGNLPDPNLTSLRPRCQHLAVPGKRQTQNGLLHHHEVVLRLVL